MLLALGRFHLCGFGLGRKLVCGAPLRWFCWLVVLVRWTDLYKRHMVQLWERQLCLLTYLDLDCKARHLFGMQDVAHPAALFETASIRAMLGSVRAAIVVETNEWIVGTQNNATDPDEATRWHFSHRECHHHRHVYSWDSSHYNQLLSLIEYNKKSPSEERDSLLT